VAEGEGEAAAKPAKGKKADKAVADEDGVIG
jgi:recombination protein RecA